MGRRRRRRGRHPHKEASRRRRRDEHAPVAGGAPHGGRRRLPPCAPFEQQLGLFFFFLLLLFFNNRRRRCCFPRADPDGCLRPGRPGQEVALPAEDGRGRHARVVLLSQGWFVRDRERGKKREREEAARVNSFLSFLSLFFLLTRHLFSKKKKKLSQRPIDVGFVCSVCLSIFCETKATCSTCGADFGAGEEGGGVAVGEKRQLAGGGQGGGGGALPRLG